MAEHICGPPEAATGPSMAHWAWHQRYKTERCGKSLRERAWYSAERRAGCPLPDYQPTIRKRHKCGPAVEATGPSKAAEWYHQQWGTPLCGKAKREKAWYLAEYRAGHTIADYQPKRHLGEGWKCGAAEDATGPFTGHYATHYREGTLPCQRARREYGWWKAERDAGFSIPNWRPENADQWRTCWLYRIWFADGSVYVGISHRPDYRHRQHQQADSPVGERIRAGMIYKFEPLFELPNRSWAEEVEAGTIRRMTEDGKHIINQKYTGNYEREVREAVREMETE